MQNIMFNPRATSHAYYHREASVHFILLSHLVVFEANSHQHAICVSKVDLEPHAGQDRRMQILGAWPYDLQVTRQVAPRSQSSVVEQLNALLVTLCESGWRKRSTQQVLEVARQTNAKITYAEGVAFAPGNEASTADPESHVPTNRIWVAVRNACDSENSPANVRGGLADPKVLVKGVPECPGAGFLSCDDALTGNVCKRRGVDRSELPGTPIDAGILMSRQTQRRDCYLDRTGQERSVREKLVQIARRWMIIRIAD